MSKNNSLLTVSTNNFISVMNNFDSVFKEESRVINNEHTKAASADINKKVIKVLHNIDDKNDFHGNVQAEKNWYTPHFKNTYNLYSKISLSTSMLLTLQTSRLINYYSSLSIDSNSNKICDSFEIADILTKADMFKLFANGMVDVKLSDNPNIDVKYIVAIKKLVENIDSSKYDKLNKIVMGYPFVSGYQFNNSVDKTDIDNNMHRLFCPLFLWDLNLTLLNNESILRVKIVKDSKNRYSFTPNYSILANFCLLNENTYQNNIQKVLVEINENISKSDAPADAFTKDIIKNFCKVITDIGFIIDENAVLGMMFYDSVQSKILNNRFSKTVDVYDRFTNISSAFDGLSYKTIVFDNSEKNKKLDEKEAKNKDLKQKVVQVLNVESTGIIDNFENYDNSFIFSKSILKITNEVNSDESFENVIAPNSTYLSCYESGTSLNADPNISYFRNLDFYQKKILDLGMKNSNSWLLVTGAPGTGKSQVIVSVLVNELMKQNACAFLTTNKFAASVVSERLGNLCVFCLNFFSPFTSISLIKWIFFQVRNLVFTLLNFISNNRYLIHSLARTKDSAIKISSSIESMFASLKSLKTAFSFGVGNDISRYNRWYNSDTKNIVETYAKVESFIRESFSAVEFWTMIDSYKLSIRDFAKIYNNAKKYLTEREIAFLLDCDFDYSKISHDNFESQATKKRLTRYLKSKNRYINNLIFGENYKNCSDIDLSEVKSIINNKKNKKDETTVHEKNPKILITKEYVNSLALRIQMWVTNALDSVTFQAFSSRLHNSKWYTKFSNFISSDEYLQFSDFNSAYTSDNFDFKKYKQLSSMIDFQLENSEAIEFENRNTFVKEVEALFAEKNEIDKKNIELLCLKNIVTNLINNNLLKQFNNLALVVNSPYSYNNYSSVAVFFEEFAPVLSIMFSFFSCSPTMLLTYIKPRKDVKVFDTIVVDESTQMPSYIISIIKHYAKMVYLFGDHNQLSPRGWWYNEKLLMHFFNLWFKDKNADFYKFVIYNFSSLYLLASTIVPSLQLNYHYRSNVNELILFNNVVFYGSDLITMNFSNKFSDPNYKAILTYDTNASEKNYADAEIATAMRLVEKEFATTKFPSILVVFNSIISRDKFLNLIKNHRNKNIQYSFLPTNGSKPSCDVKIVPEVQGMEADNIIMCCEVAPFNKSKNKILRREDVGNFGIKNEGVKYLNVVTSRAKAHLHVIKSFDVTNLDANKMCDSLETALFMNFVKYATYISKGISKASKEIITILYDSSLINAKLNSNRKIEKIAGQAIDEGMTLTTALNTSTKTTAEEEGKVVTNELYKYLKSLSSKFNSNITMRTNVNLFEDFNANIALYDNKSKKFLCGFSVDAYSTNFGNIEAFEQSLYYNYEFAKFFGWNLMRISTYQWSNASLSSSKLMDNIKSFLVSSKVISEQEMQKMNAKNQKANSPKANASLEQKKSQTKSKAKAKKGRK